MDFVDLGRARITGIAVLAIAIAAIALLFAGQGPVVAAGALVGMILGAIAGLIGLLWLRGGAGRSISFGTLQLIAIEQRTAGATLSFEGRAGLGVPAPMGMPLISVTDDLGTAYRVASEGMGGGPWRIRFDATMAPAPPAGARAHRQCPAIP